MTVLATPTTTVRPLVLIAASSYVAAMALMAFGLWGGHDTEADALPQFLVLGAVLALVVAGVFALPVRRGLAHPPAADATLVLGIIGALLVLPAFWSGIPFVLGVAAIALGRAARGSGSSRASAGLILGYVTIAGVAGLYVFDYLVN
jgi:hypothetical protein